MAAAPIEITNASTSACRVPSLLGVTLFDDHGRFGPRLDQPPHANDIALLSGDKQVWLLLYAHRGGAGGTVEGSNYPRAEVTGSGGLLGSVRVLCRGLHVSTDVDGPPLDERLVQRNEPPTTAPDLTNC
jgi:hypothetical protein